MAGTSADVLVIGGGIHGCAAAYFLARRGLRVVVLEKDRVGLHASGRNAGGVRQLGRDLAELPISAAAMELWYELAALLGDDGGFRVSAQVRVAESDADMAQLEARAKTVRERGFTHEEILDRAQLRALVPALAEHCVGGLVSRRDGFATPYRATLAFARAARALGATILEGTRVVGIERSAGRWAVATADAARFAAPHLLNTAGAWGHRVAQALGENVPLAFAPYMITVTSRLPAFVKPVVIGTSRPLSFKQVENGSVVIGGGYTGTGDLDGGLIRVGVTAIAQNVRTAAELFPILMTAAVARGWAGLEGVLPDHIPVIGRSVSAPDAYHAFGFCGHGFQLAPAVGSLMAELIATGATNLPIAPFRIDRFAAAEAEVSVPAPG